MKLSLAASPAYLLRRGRPSRIEDLMGRDLLAANTIPFWDFNHANKTVRIPVKAKYSIYSLRLIIQAACAGVGVCLIPNITLAAFVEQGQLETLLPDVECPAGIACLVWVDRKPVAARVTAFREMVIDRLSEPSGLLTSISKPSQ